MYIDVIIFAMKMVVIEKTVYAELIKFVKHRNINKEAKMYFKGLKMALIKLIMLLLGSRMSNVLELWFN
jgi:hypothetical protein